MYFQHHIKLTEEFDKMTADNRNAKTAITLGNGNFVQKQTRDGKTTTQIMDVVV